MIEKQITFYKQRQLETQRLKLLIDESYLKNAKKIVVTLQSKNNIIYKSSNDDDVEVYDERVEISLSQEDTRRLYGIVEIQVNILNNSGARLVSDISKIVIDRTTYSEVMA